MTRTSTPDSLLKILDRQISQWEFRHRMAAQGGEKTRREFAHLEQGPWITISKSLGSGWDEVARSVGTQLGWQVLDRQILDEIAQHTHAREQILSRLDERSIQRLEDATMGLVAADYPGQSAYVLEMRAVMEALAHQGRTILVGRGANWFLNPARGLRVRISAPRSTRAERLAGREGMALSDAERLIEVDDADKTSFIKQVFGRDIEDPEGYDLILNLGSLGAEAAADCILAALRRKLGAV